MQFEPTEEQYLQFVAWNEKHVPECPMYGRATLGGRLTWCFTPTGLGTLIEVKCKCGSGIDLSDTENW